MNIETQSHFNQMIADVRNHVCVQAWIGHGNKLYIGFGDKIYDGQTLPGHITPDAEIHTVFSTWNLIDTQSGERIASSEEDMDHSEKEYAMVQRVVGRKSIDTELSESPLCLRIDLEGGVALIIDPYPDAECRLDVACTLRDQYGTYCVVYCDGMVITHSEHEFVPDRDRPNNHLVCGEVVRIMPRELPPSRSGTLELVGTRGIVTDVYAESAEISRRCSVFTNDGVVREYEQGDLVSSEIILSLPDQPDECDSFIRSIMPRIESL